MAEVRANRDTPWETVMEPLPAGSVGVEVAYENISVISGLKSYSLRNGNPEDVEPYLLTSAIPAHYHWVPINGLAPKDAIKCVDGFIKSHLFKLAGSQTGAGAVEAIRREAIILGTCRAVMTANFDLITTDINAKELATPLLSVNVPEEGAPVYTTLVAANSPNVEVLTGNLALTEAELEAVKVIARCAQAIVPVQGLNLITDGHHYLSEKSKQSYKAFLAVERQVWAPRAFKDWMGGSEEKVRDIMWHKAGHPVAVALKESAATDPAVKANLEAAKMGSASARLPALEADLRSADTYLKLAEAVGAIWSTVGGSVGCDMLRYRVDSVKAMARTKNDFEEPVDMGDEIKVANRQAAVAVLRATVSKNSDKAAILYGFYCAMLDMGTGDMSGAANDTLRSAYSLKKLKQNNIASYLIGSETYRDYRAIKAAARKSADRKMPELTYDN